MGNPLFIFLQAVLAEADKELEYVRPCRLNVYKKKDDKTQNTGKEKKKADFIYNNCNYISVVCFYICFGFFCFIFVLLPFLRNCKMARFFSVQKGINRKTETQRKAQPAGK